MSFEEVLVWLANSGGGAMVASWVLEQLAWYQGLASDKKRLVFFGCAIVISLAGYFGLMYIPKDIIDKISPIFAIVYGTFATIFIGTGFHKLTKAEDKG